jgi:glycosyltransferase involved in cell wall biosynthesis
LVPDSAAELSVVVLCYDDRSTVLAAVESLLRQGSPQVEVVVVASGGFGEAQLVAERYPEIKVFDSPQRLLPGGARNRGIECSLGKVVAFLAADCLAGEGWVAKRLDAHRRGHRAVASAVTLAPPFRPWSFGAHLLMYPDRFPTRQPGMVEPPDAAVHGMSLARDLLDQVGPYREDLRIGEDTEMAERIDASGERIFFEPSIQTLHRGPRSTRAMLSDQFRRGARSVPYRSGFRGHSLTLGKVALRRSFRRVRYSLRSVKGVSEAERLKIAVAVPWLVAASLAYHLGMWVTQARARRSLGPRPLDERIGR